MQQQIDELKSELTVINSRISTFEDRFNQLVECQQKNTDALNRLITETRDVVQLYKDIQGAARVGVGFQKFGVWVIKWPLIGAGLFAAYKWIGLKLSVFFG